MSNEPQIAVVDVDYANYIGDEADGVYYQTAKGPDGWYVSSIVDSDTGSFCGPLVTDDGPYESETAALMSGEAEAIEWCVNNGVEWQEDKEP